MVVIRPDHADFAFPAGRYALVLKKEAYDFTVDGAIHDRAHCLERTDALGGGVYSGMSEAIDIYVIRIGERLWVPTSSS